MTGATDGRPRRARSALFWKIFGAHFGIVFLLTVGAAVWFPRHHIAGERRELERKAVAYASELSEDLEAAVAFDDADAAREIFGAMTGDNDVSTIALFASNGQRIASYGPEVKLASPVPKNEAVLETRRHSVRVIVPVVSREGPRGTIVLELSTADLERDLRAAQIEAVGFGIVGLVLGGVAAFFVGRSLSRRVGRLSRAANTVAAGGLAVADVEDGGADEIGDLADAFNAMVRDLRRLVGHIEENAKTEAARLEAIVEQRTAELVDRNTELRLLLDNVDQGFVTIDRAGRMGPARSAALDGFFGPPGAVDEPLAIYLDRIDRNVGRWFTLAFEQLIDDVMPREVSLAGLPSTLTHEGRDYRLTYTPILDAGGAIERVLFVVTDATESNALARAEERRREAHDVLERAFADTRGFFSFYTDAERMIGDLFDDRLPLVDAQRALHTLKGNAGLFGLRAFGDFCHHLEGRSRLAGKTLQPVERDQLLARWSAATAPVVTLFADRLGRVDIDESEIDLLLADLERDAPRSQLVALARSFRFEPFARRLRHLGDRAITMAASIGKHDVVARIDGGNARFDPVAWTPFWSAFVHAIHNAVDHGIEPPAARERAQKPAWGTLELSVVTDETRLILTMRDDGAGIRWDRVAEQAEAHGLPHATQRDLIEALFADGVSTSEDVTETSGRGVGMAALRQACRDLGGEVEVESELGVGTALRFVFPRARIAHSVRIAPRGANPATEARR